MRPLRQPVGVFIIQQLWKQLTLKQRPTQSITHVTKQGRFDAFRRSKAKIDYLVLDAKLILINMNYVKKFLFLEIL